MVDQMDNDDRKKRVFEAQMRLASYEWPEQEPWVRDWTNRVLREHASNEHLRTGQHLYMLLPKEFQTELVSTLHDPFHANLHKADIIQWFIRHITFDEKGAMVILRDYERALEMVAD